MRSTGRICRAGPASRRRLDGGWKSQRGERGLGVVVVNAGWLSGAGWPNGPPSGRLANREVVGSGGVSGGLVVNGFAGFRGPGWPNGPPSPRLAPGGFYAVATVPSFTE